MAHTASNPIRAYFVINFDLSARKRLQSVVLRYFMQTSRVNGLTSGVFAFLVPASCLNQKGSDTRSDNTTFPFAGHVPAFSGYYYKNAGDGENLLFPVSGVGQLSNAKASVISVYYILLYIFFLQFDTALSHLTYAQTSLGTLSYNLFIVNSARRWSAADLKASRSLSDKS